MKQGWRLDGRRALVTGGTRGIGLATARELLGLGADVALVARDGRRLEQVLGELARDHPGRQVRGLAMDLAYPEHLGQVAAWLAEDWRELHVLVNNVGSNLRAGALDYRLEDLHRILDSNLSACFELCRQCHALLAAAGDGAIVNVASVAGLTHVGTGAPYAMSKAAMVQLTRTLACEWADDGIRVNAVAPWYIETELVKPVLEQEAFLAEVRHRTPLRRVGQPAEAAAAVAFLCLPAASYVTGQCLAVDGGFLAYGFSPP